MSGVRQAGSGSEKSIRLSRGQSHDLLTRLENVGLTTELAAQVIDGDPTIAYAMVQATRAAMDADFGLAKKWDPKRLGEDGAAQLQLQFEGWYARYDFPVPVSEPNVTPAEIMLRRILGYKPFYLPKRTKSFDIEKLAIVSQCVDLHLGEPNEIKWENGGYWFWGEIVRNGPFPERRRRRGCVFTAIRPSLEQYLVMWLHERDANDRRPFDALDTYAVLQMNDPYAHRAFLVATDHGDRLAAFYVGDRDVKEVRSRAVDRIPDAP